MKQNRKNVFRRMLPRIRSICRELELFKGRLLSIGDTKVDPSDPYSQSAEDVADNIDYAQRLLADQVLGLLGCLCRTLKK